MRITCGACGRKTAVADELRSREFNFQCPACKRVMKVPAENPASPPVIETPVPPPPFAAANPLPQVRTEAPKRPTSTERPKSPSRMKNPLYLAGGVALVLLIASVCGAIAFRKPATPKEVPKAEDIAEAPAAEPPPPPVVPVPATGRPRKIALLVGVEGYNGKSLAPLKYAEDDARDLADVFRSLGFEVTQLGDEAGKQDPRLKPIRKHVVGEIHKALNGRSHEDLVVIGLMGHGLQLAEAKDSFFCPLDAEPNVAGVRTLVSMNGLYANLESCGAGAKILLVDACRNDPGQTRGLNASDAPLPPRGVVALFSCSSGQVSHEFGHLKHGIFSHFVLEGLRGRAADDQGEVTYDSLSSFVRRETAKTVPQFAPGAQQSPNDKGEKSGLPIVLAGRDDVARISGLPPPKPPIETAIASVEPPSIEPAAKEPNASSRSPQKTPNDQAKPLTDDDIATRLQQEATLEFQGISLRDALAAVSEKHKIPIRIESNAFDNLGISDEVRIKYSPAKKSKDRVFEVLHRILGDLKLNYFYGEGELVVTTDHAVQRMLIPRTYNVSSYLKKPSGEPNEDLLLKIRQIQPDHFSGGRGSIVIQKHYNNSYYIFYAYVMAHPKVHKQISALTPPL